MFTEGEHWQVQRRFTLQQMRNFGFGKKSQEAVIHEEVEELVERLSKEKGPVHMQVKSWWRDSPKKRGRCICR